ncbi:MAG: class I SAM-dependent methyltransferase [Gammaproteobacteria bacterium]|nr:class I SAM-dependent methyltransferase [Gammaproteobacteria bacterium]
MGFYSDRILPRCIDRGCAARPVSRQREKVVPQAQGRVLEVGMGSGLNLPFYDADRVELVWGLEPSDGMRRRAKARVEGAPFEVRWLGLPAEEIPLEDDSADTIVVTYTLCTVRGWRTALAQMRRVLKPGGRLLFSEHGRAPDAAVRRWQDRLDPFWSRIAGGCHLNRDIPGLLARGGFVVRELEAMYLPSTPRFAGFTYWGYAV